MTPHVELGILAELVDGALPAGEARMARAHLNECRSCMAAYVDAVRYRAAWLADPEAFMPDREALRLAGHDRPLVAPDRSDRARMGAAARVLQLSAAAVLVACAAAWLFAGRAPSLEFELPPAVRAATEHSSARGLVLPGVAAGVARIEPELRAGQRTVSPALEREVRATIAAYERGQAGADAGARVVAALLAAGEIDAACDYSRECLRRSPHHVTLLVFAADARYRSNDLVGAEELLRDAARRAPRDPVVTLDLAMVLRQLGHEDEGLALLRRVATSQVPWLAARATRELSRVARS